MPKVAINGFGRIGRAALKILHDVDGVELAAVDDLVEVGNLASLPAHDSVCGRYGRTVAVSDGALSIDGHNVPVYAERDPARLPWREPGIDITALTGSGPGGRVVRADVEAAVHRGEAHPADGPSATGPSAEAPAAPQPPAQPLADAGEVEEVSLTAVRRLTAQRLTDSARQVPHFYLTVTVDAEPLLAFRADLNTRLGPRVSVNDLIIRACATALREHPEMNASWYDTRILRHRRIHIGIAVALDDGLTVPVIHDADRKTLTGIAREARTLADKARSGHLTLDDLTGGTFTISDLGPYGIDHFTAVVNPPQAAILAVGAARPEPVVRDGKLTPGTVMALTLSIDHRVLDGATGAAFLDDLKELLEQPLRIVVQKGSASWKFPGLAPADSMTATWRRCASRPRICGSTASAAGSCPASWCRGSSVTRSGTRPLTLSGEAAVHEAPC